MYVAPLRLGRITALLALAAVISAAAYGFTGTNTVPPSSAGDGAGTISGYNVTNVQYFLNASNPQVLDRVEFDLDAPAGTVTVRLVTPAGTWYSCTNPSGNHWQCNTPGASVAAANELRVVAVQ